MARKYARDNRGRFAPKGAGATARGGRLKTASGNKRETQKIAALSGDRMSSVPKGTVGRTRKQREITMIDRPQGQRPGYNAGRAQQQGLIAARKAAKPVASKRIKANAPANTLGNKTGQSKTLNKFNSRPERTRGAYVGGRYVDKAKLTGRQPLDLGRGDDRAFGRVATKAARSRAAATSTRLDTAMVNIPMRGARGRRLDADISRAVKQVKAAETARLMKPKAQVKAERAARAEARRTAQTVKPKRTRSQESLRMSRANQVEKRRGMNISNPAAWRQESAGRMAANAKRTQERALAFYKGGGKAAKPAAKPAPKAATSLKSARMQGAALSRQASLQKGAQRNNARADRIDAKVASLEKQYRGKDAAFYTQGAKPAGRDQMIAKSRQAAQLREQSASLRQKASNAQRMASRIKPAAAPKASGGNARLQRAINNEAAGSTQARRNPKGYQKRITALTAQKIYKTGDFMAGLTVAKTAGKGFRLPRPMRRR